MTEKKTWKEFKDAKLLWWINRSLHLFGWAIVVQEEKDGSLSEVYPARVKFRGFHEQVEEEGFRGLSSYLADVSEDLKEESK